MGYRSHILMQKSITGEMKKFKNDFFHFEIAMFKFTQFRFLKIWTFPD